MPLWQQTDLAKWDTNAIYNRTHLNYSNKFTVRMGNHTIFPRQIFAVICASHACNLKSSDRTVSCPVNRRKEGEYQCVYVNNEQYGNLDNQRRVCCSKPGNKKRQPPLHFTAPANSMMLYEQHENLRCCETLNRQSPTTETHSYMQIATKPHSDVQTPNTSSQG